MTAIAKALSILELCGRQDTISVPEIVSGTGLPRSTAVRIVGELMDRGFLERAERGRYRPGPTIRTLARASISEDAMHARAREQLRRLVEATGETAHYAIYDAGSSLYVDKLDGSHPILAYTKIGGRSPAYATATGKALLAWQSDDEIARVAAEAKRFTRSTLASLEHISVERKRIRIQGYAVNRGEWRDGVWGVAAAVFGADGTVVAAIGLSGPEQRLRPRLKSLAGLVVDAAGRISGVPARRSA